MILHTKDLYLRFQDDTFSKFPLEKHLRKMFCWFLSQSGGTDTTSRRFSSSPSFCTSVWVCMHMHAYMQSNMRTRAHVGVRARSLHLCFAAHSPFTRNERAYWKRTKFLDFLPGQVIPTLALPWYSASPRNVTAKQDYSFEHFGRIFTGKPLTQLHLLVNGDGKRICTFHEIGQGVKIGEARIWGVA